MKKSRKVIAFLFSFLLVFSLMGTVIEASGPMDGQVVDGSILTSEKQVFETKDLVPENPFNNDIMPYGTYLSNGTAGITDKGGGVVYISGETYCYRYSDEVFVELYLQRLSNGSWNTIKTQSSIEYNTYAAYASMSFLVLKGYYYRVVGAHYAKKGNKVESVTTCTNGIYIG